jgi:hypothetical protein
MRAYRSGVVSLRSAEAKPPRSVHRLDESAELSLSMVASPQRRFRFARQNYSSAAASSAVNFRIARDPGAIRKWVNAARQGGSLPACPLSYSVFKNAINAFRSSTDNFRPNSWPSIGPVCIQ